MKIKKKKSYGLHFIFSRENKEAGWVVSEVAVEENGVKQHWHLASSSI